MAINYFRLIKNVAFLQYFTNVLIENDFIVLNINY